MTQNDIKIQKSKQIIITVQTKIRIRHDKCLIENMTKMPYC